MRTFAQTQKPVQGHKPATPARRADAFYGQSRAKHTGLHVQQVLGNQAMQRLLRANGEERVEGEPPPLIQTKLTVNPPSDKYEQEADRVAEEVMRISEPARDSDVFNSIPAPNIQRITTRPEPELVQLDPLQPDPFADPLDDPRMHPEDTEEEKEKKEKHKAALTSKKCSIPSHCPPGFCDPFPNTSMAKHQRAKQAPFLLLGISLFIDSRVVPLWREHINGGSPPKDLSSTFGSDFEKSKTTSKTTTFLINALKKNLKSAPPTPPSSSKTTTLDVTTHVSKEIAEIDKPKGSNTMNFNIPSEVPGNIAGDIGKDQAACKVGAKPSPFDDERKATISATISNTTSGDLFIKPTINYSVKDTIDLCPGNCGDPVEWIATIPISQFEATGISGDVPFTVEFSDTASPFVIPGPKPAKP